MPSGLLSRRQFLASMFTPAIAKPTKTAVKPPLPGTPKPEFWFGEKVEFCWTDETSGKHHTESGEIVGATWNHPEAQVGVHRHLAQFHGVSRRRISNFRRQFSYSRYSFRSDRMNKQELIETIAQKRGMNPEAVAYDLALAYDEIFAAIVKAVAQGEIVEIPDFGRFHRTWRSFNRNCMPGSKKMPGFTPDLAFRDAVSAGVAKGVEENDN